MPISTANTTRDRILSAINKLPPFEPVVTKILALLAKEDASFRELAGLIENDTVLTGNLLRVVNSPLYGHPAEVSSVRHAIALAGMIKVRNMVLALSVSRRWVQICPTKRWSTPQFNLHSLAVAIMADQLVLNSETSYPEGAFIAGLLHDVGKLLTAIATPIEMTKMFDAGEERNVWAWDLEEEFLGVSHAEISASVLESWNLPTPIRDAVLSHHHPPPPEKRFWHLAHIVQAADRWARRAGYPSSPEVGAVSEDDDAFHDPILQDRMASLELTFENEFRAITVVT